ncbi:hypothetical protein IQ07DRAFT_632208 [Pyrenochaeta sp. DS3sAY3a]|nr:hypothetical protein IQ07DRAFT_632208 [Pyrenochaeta sp. DS3sAY3a]
MGNVMTWFQHLRSRITSSRSKSRHQHNQSGRGSPYPPRSTPSPPQLPPTKPTLHPVPSEIITATEKGMIGENLLCASLPSPMIQHHDPLDTTTPGGPFDEAFRGGSGASEDSVRYEDEVRVVLTRGEEACRGGGGGMEGRSGRCVKWKGIDV